MFISSSPFSRILNSRILFMPDDPGGSNPSNPQQNPQPEPKDLDDKIRREVERLASRHDGDLLKAAMTYYKDAHTQRERAEALEKQVMSEADRKTIESVNNLLQSIGAKSVDELKTRLENGEAAAQKAGELEQEKILGEAAQVLNLKNNMLYRSLLKDVPVKVEGEGENRKVVIEQEGKAVSFEDYAKTREDLQDALPALATSQQQTVTGVHRGAPIGGGQPQNKYERIRQEVREKEKQQAPPENTPDRLRTAGIQ